MSTVVALQNPIRCFCSLVAKHTNNNLYVCGKYKSGGMVCLFHLHEENSENYYKTTICSMPFDCEMCLATLKIHSKEYIAPCRLTSIRCECSEVVNFNQSKKDNLNNSRYFFGCPNWRTPGKRCTFFFWSHEYQTIRDSEILRQLIPENEIISKPLVNNDKYEELKKKYECIVCLSAERSHLILPCYHLCCCSECSTKIQAHCPICRGPINSIQRIFCV